MIRLSKKFDNLFYCIQGGIKIKKFKFNEYDLYFSIGNYSSNNKLAVSCYTKDEDFSSITINLPTTFSNFIDEAFIDPINKDIGLYKALIDNGIIKEVIKENVLYNMGHYDLVRFDLDKLKEYDSKGYQEFFNTLSLEENISKEPKI